MYKIYRIIDNTNGNIYIGKTEQTLKERLSIHKCDKSCASREIIKNGDYKIELIEETDDESRERYYIENNESVNKNIPGRTQKEWYQDNKEKLSQYHKEYYENNIDKIKKYRQNNKDKISQYQKEYHKELRQYTNSWGGDPRSNNNLLKIDPNLFL